MNFEIDYKKKVLFIIPSLVGGGAERMFVHLINHFDKDKYDIFLVLFENKLDYKKDLFFPVKIVCLSKKGRWDFFKLILKLRKLMCDYKPAVVISSLHYTNIVTVLASMFMKRKFRVILCEQNYPRKYLPEVRLGYLKRWLMKLTYRKADGIVAVSKSIKRVLQHDFNVESEKTRTIYNSISLEAIREKSQEEIEHPFFKDKNAEVIISAGRLVEQKRFDRLLIGFSLVREKQDSVFLIILGKGELRKELESLAAKLKVSKWIDFVGFKSNPFAWISKADIFVLSSNYEGLPMVLLEAMACGTPVISTDCPSGPKEIITNGKNGILVPPADEEALARAMLTLLKNESLRKKLSEEGIKRAEDFRMEKILPQYEELL